ncbi:MAG: alkaline phosphatase D family protein, partial [Arenicellales bacterium]
MKWLVTAIAVCCSSVTVAEEAISRIAFGSCAFQSVPQPVFRAIADSKPDLYLSLGDAIYADYDLKKHETYDVTQETLQREWQVLADSPDWQYLTSRVPVMATWDNHDYGHYQAGEEFALKKASKEIFLDFFAEPKGSERRKRPGIYDAKIIGEEGRRVQIILLDTRSFKTPSVLAKRPEGARGSLGKFAPNTDPAASLLGDAQWRWLEQQLQQPAELR